MIEEIISETNRDIITITQITEKPAVDSSELAIRSEIQLLIARATKNKRCLFGYL